MSIEIFHKYLFRKNRRSGGQREVHQITHGGLLATPENHGGPRFQTEIAFHLPVGGFSYNYGGLLLPTYLQEAGGHIHHVPDNGKIHAFVRANIADDGLPGVDAHPHTLNRGGPLLFQGVEALLHGDGTGHRLAGSLGHFQRRPKEGHQAVPQKLVQGALVFKDQVHHLGEIMVEHFHHFGGIPLLGKRGKSLDIGEEHGHMTPLAA